MKLSLLASAALTFGSLAFAGHASATAATDLPSVNRAYLNTAVSPCVDFYTYANGGFDSVAIPGEYSSYGVNQEIDERNFAILHDILEASAKAGGPTGSVAQRVGDFYAAGMDEAAIEHAGLAPLAPLFAQIAAIRGADEILPAIARLQIQGIDAGYDFHVQVDDKDSSTMIAGFSQGGLGLPERDYYLRDDAEAEKTRTAYVAHITRMFVLAGDMPANAAAEARTIMALETRLARASRPLVDLRDPEKNYHKFLRRELVHDVAALPWNDVFTAIAFPDRENHVLVGQPEFFAALAQLLHSEPLDAWRAYLRWHVLDATADYLGHAFVDEHFAFYGRTLSGATELRPRWKRVLSAADSAIGEDLGQLYVQRAFSPTAKARVLAMVKFHLAAMHDRIAAADWMSEPTKQAAYAKLATMRAKIGYPDRWRDYSALTLTRDSYVGNVLAADAFEFRRQLAKLGRPVDRDEWLMTPQTNNAYYDPTLNEMCFPAGILQPPFFNEDADDAANYGALASTIGHELTHGFDDQGRQYDAHGNLHDWWTAGDAKAFDARAEQVAQQYDAFEVLPGLHINGHQTLGENIADVGGLRVSYEAFKLATANQRLREIDGFTPDQRFFIAFAQGWRTNQRPEAVRLQVQSNVHSPVRWRVLGPVANFPEFYAAFGCPAPRHTWPPIW
jgi:predicted metalloendopeptidase